MDVILTSFGVGMKAHGPMSIFHRMPPLFLEGSERLFERGISERFHLDYASLFMFDRVIVDERSYERSVNPDYEDSRRESPRMSVALKEAAVEYAQVLTALRRSGRLVTKNFDDSLSRSKNTLESAMASDMKDLSRWIQPLTLAIKEWSQVNQRFRADLRRFHEDETISVGEKSAFMMTAHVLANSSVRSHFLLETLKRWKSKQPAERRKECRDLLYDYLAYMNFNLLLSFEHQAPFIDWMDMHPLYKHKFQTAAERSAYTSRKQAPVEQSRRLFEFLFPYFVPRSISELLKAIDDIRVDKLRQFVRESINEGRNFDSVECIHLLKEILRLEQKAAFRRKITGWATLPVGFIPLFGTPLQKGAEELVNRIWSDRPSHEYSWYYLISDIDSSIEGQ